MVIAQGVVVNMILYISEKYEGRHYKARNEGITHHPSLSITVSYILWHRAEIKPRIATTRPGQQFVGGSYLIYA